MASYTPNYNLKKPADADSYDIADANGNMDLIDSALNTLNGKIDGKITTHSFTGITNSNGLLFLTDTNSSDTIIAAHCGYYPLCLGYDPTSGHWFVLVVEISNNAVVPYPNHQLTIYYQKLH